MVREEGDVVWPWSVVTLFQLDHLCLRETPDENQGVRIFFFPWLRYMSGVLYEIASLPRCLRNSQVKGLLMSQYLGGNQELLKLARHGDGRMWAAVIRVFTPVQSKVNRDLMHTTKVL